MVQKIFGLGLGGSGIVAVLIIAGILTSGTNPDISSKAISGGITIGLILGGLGIFGVIVTLDKRLG